MRWEPESEIPQTPLGIAAEMAKLVLEMRDTDRNAGAKKQKLELLAEPCLADHREREAV